MAVETRYADGNTTVISGVTGVANALGAPNGSYTTNTDHTNWTERFSIGNPTNPLTAGATDHSVFVTCRKSAAGGNGDPTLQVDLYDNGVLVRTLRAAAAITDATTSVGPFTFTTAEVSNAANVQVQLAIVGQGGTPAGRRNVQVDGITVAFNTAAAAPKVVPVNQVSSPGVAQATTSRKRAGAGQPSEAAIAQAVTVQQTSPQEIPVNQTTTADATLPPTRSKAYALGWAW